MILDPKRLAYEVDLLAIVRDRFTQEKAYEYLATMAASVTDAKDTSVPDSSEKRITVWAYAVTDGPVSDMAVRWRGDVYEVQSCESLQGDVWKITAARKLKTRKV